MDVKLRKPKNDPNVVSCTYDSRGRLQTVIQYVIPKPSQSQPMVPIWVVVLTALAMTSIAIILGASILLVFSKRAGLFNESCTGRSCMNGLNMKCINGHCQCSSDDYYQKGCQPKKNYSEQCFGSTNYCIDNLNLVCMNGFCICNSTSFWNSGKCVNKKKFGESCLSSDQCLTGTKLFCDLKTSLCSCSNDR